LLLPLLFTQNKIFLILIVISSVPPSFSSVFWIGDKGGLHIFPDDRNEMCFLTDGDYVTLFVVHGRVSEHRFLDSGNTKLDRGWDPPSPFLRDCEHFPRLEAWDILIPLKQRGSEILGDGGREEDIPIPPLDGLRMGLDWEDLSRTPETGLGVEGGGRGETFVFVDYVEDEARGVEHPGGGGQRSSRVIVSVAPTSGGWTSPVGM
jgi:hypothetical protein